MPGKDDEHGTEPGAEPVDEDETISESKTCPECGEPIENVRATCPNCGYEYSDKDYDQPEAGSEFVTGSEIDESGEEILDESGAVASDREDG